MPQNRHLVRNAGQMDDEGSASDFVRAFHGTPLAGFHTYGETWLGHINQTLTGVIFGR